MSASLVGSEMCIRDRLPRVTQCVILRWRGTKALATRGPERTCRVSEAVSYTHLTLPTICSV
eukprot:7915001-Alexandrium_andersonii.AAC.1